MSKDKLVTAKYVGEVIQEFNALQFQGTRNLYRFSKETDGLVALNGRRENEFFVPTRIIPAENADLESIYHDLGKGEFNNSGLSAGTRELHENLEKNKFFCNIILPEMLVGRGITGKAIIPVLEIAIPYFPEEHAKAVYVSREIFEKVNQLTPGMVKVGQSFVDIMVQELEEAYSHLVEYVGNDMQDFRAQKKGLKDNHEGYHWPCALSSNDKLNKHNLVIIGRAETYTFINCFEELEISDGYFRPSNFAPIYYLEAYKDFLKV